MLELRGAAPGLLDDPLLLEVGGAAPGSALVWRARIRDDDGFVWRAEGASPDAWRWSAKAGDAAANLRSLRPVELEVRVEGDDGAATRTLTRTVVADGVKLRRWRDGVTGRLFLPAAPTATIVVGEAPNTIISAALLASRGVRVFVVAGGDPAALPFDGARRLDALPLPPGLPTREATDPAPWDALLAELGATPRRVER